MCCGCSTAAGYACRVDRIWGHRSPTDDENHGWILVQFNSVENAWARDITSQYFGYACVAMYGGSRSMTVSDCRSLSPISIITGGRRYAFVLDDCTYMLVQNCYTDQDRHQFVTGSLTTGPNAGKRVLYVRDPDGTTIELMQPPSPS